MHSYDDNLNLEVGKNKVKEFYQGGVADEELFNYKPPKVDFNPLKLDEHDFFGELECNTKKSNIKSYFTNSYLPFDKVTLKPTKKREEQQEYIIRKPVENDKDKKKSKRNVKNNPKFGKKGESFENSRNRQNDSFSLPGTPVTSTVSIKNRTLPYDVAQRQAFKKRIISLKTLVC